MNFKKIALTALFIGKSLLLLLGCPNSSSDPGSSTNGGSGEAFNEAAFREWAGRPERAMLSVTGGTAVFTDTFINDAVTFARNNWNRNEYRNNASTFNRLTTQFANQTAPEALRPITVTKGGKAFNYANPLGSYMFGSKTHPRCVVVLHYWESTPIGCFYGV